jgi:hypothetical protein
MLYASIRQYRTRDAGEVARRASQGFVPIVREIPGFVAYYLVDGGDGTLITVTVTEAHGGAEESATKAAEWTRENLADLIEGDPTIVNGEVTTAVSTQIVERTPSDLA